MLGMTHPFPHPLTSIILGPRTGGALELHLNQLKVCCGREYRWGSGVGGVGEGRVGIYSSYVSLFLIAINTCSVCVRVCMRVVPLKQYMVIAPLVSAGDEETQFENEREREEWEQEQKVRISVCVCHEVCTALQQRIYHVIPAWLVWAGHSCLVCKEVQW